MSPPLLWGRYLVTGQVAADDLTISYLARDTTSGSEVLIRALRSERLTPDGMFELDRLAASERRLVRRVPGAYITDVASRPRPSRPQPSRLRRATPRPVPRARRWAPTVGLACLTIAAGGLAAAGPLMALDVRARLQPRAVPNVTGATVAQARARLRAKGLRLRAQRQFDVPGAPGMIAEQRPPAGRKLSPGQAVDVLVSAGARPVTVPSVQGMSAAEAQAVLQLADLQVVVDHVPVGHGARVRTRPKAGTRLRRGDVVTLLVGTRRTS